MQIDFHPHHHYFFLFYSYPSSLRNNSSYTPVLLMDLKAKEETRPRSLNNGATFSDIQDRFVSYKNH